MSEIVVMQNGLPSFDAQTYPEHVEAWREVADQLEERLWALGAIAASLTKRYGEKVIPEFASDVNYSARRIWELAATYKAFENRDRAQDLSFKHHTIAARDEDPDKAIEVAIEGDGQRPYSTREFEEARGHRDTPKNTETVTRIVCPDCGVLFDPSQAETRTVEK